MDAENDPVEQKEEPEEAKDQTKEKEDVDGAAAAKNLLEDAYNSSGGSDMISLEKLHMLEAAFELADEDGGGGLDHDEFVNAFGNVLGNNLNDRQLTQLFMKIDANSDGSVDWQEFTEYLLLENRGAELMKKAESKCEYMPSENVEPEKNKRFHHSKRIISLRNLKELGMYATCSEDGSVRLWQATRNLIHYRTITHKPGMPIFESFNVQQDMEPNAKGDASGSHSNSRRTSSFPIKLGTSGNAWVNDCCFMSRSNKLAVATSDRTISFYDTTIGFECVGRIRPLTCSPVLLDYYCGPLSEDREILVCGDDYGYIHVWHLEPGQWSFPDCAVNIQRRADRPIGVFRYFRHRVHDEIVNHLLFDEEIGCIVSASLDNKIQFTDIDKRRIIRSFCCHRKAVYSFIWIAKLKLICSVGMERRMIFWNPYTCAIQREIDDPQLVDCPIRKLCLNSKEHQLITMSERNVIRIWDLFTFSCVQEIASRDLSSKFSDILYDPKNLCLVMASRTLSTRRAHKVEIAVKKSHEYPVTCALYNKNFFQLVTAAAFEIHVWDIYTGKMTFRFINPHDKSNLTCMCFDVGGRRLITGGHDGTIKIWNFNNGACLGEFSKMQNGVPPPLISISRQDTEVTSVACFKDVVEGSGYRVEHEYLVASGWDRRIFVFGDTKEEYYEYDLAIPLERHVEMAHQDDVNCVVYCKNNTICSAGDDGRIIWWSLASGFLKQRVGHSVSSRKEIDPSLRITEPALVDYEEEKIRIARQAEEERERKEALIARRLARALANESDNEEEEEEHIRALDQQQQEEAKAAETEEEEDGESDEYDEDDDDVMKHRIRMVRRQTLPDRKSRPLQGAKKEVPPEVFYQDTPLSARAGKDHEDRLKDLMAQRERRDKKRRLKGVPKPDRMAVENIIYLERLNCIVSSGADGFLRFWDSNNGKMMIEIDCKHPAEESIIALAVDEEQNNFLFTGDTLGTVKSWDISGLLPVPLLSRCTFRVKFLNKWKAHTDAISNMQYILWTDGVETPLNLLITTSADCSVLLWHLDGTLVGMFGAENPWSLVNIVSWAGKRKKIAKQAKRLGECLNTFNLFTTKMKKVGAALKTEEELIELRKLDNEANIQDAHTIQKARLRNKFKLRFLTDLEEKVDHHVEEEEENLYASDARRMQNGGAKPRDMPPKPSVRQQTRDQQIMHRMHLPSLDAVYLPPKRQTMTSKLSKKLRKTGSVPSF